jgi:hypothetical protein
MSPPIISRRSLAAFAAAWLTLSGSVNAATVLVEFDFDDAFGNFEISSEAQHPELASATFSVTTGALTDYAGNPGRALATNAFAPLNAIRLTLTARPGSGLQLEHLRFDLRRSASGPQQWQVAGNGTVVATGTASTHFSTVTVNLNSMQALPSLFVDFIGSSASSAAGTLRLDNVVLEGTVSSVPVPLPAPIWLLGSVVMAAVGVRRSSRVRPLPPSIEEGKIQPEHHRA